MSLSNVCNNKNHNPILLRVGYCPYCRIERLEKSLKKSEKVLIQKSKLEEIFKALEQAEVQIPYNIVVKINKLLKEVGILK